MSIDTKLALELADYLNQMNVYYCDQIIRDDPAVKAHCKKLSEWEAMLRKSVADQAICQAISEPLDKAIQDELDHPPEDISA